MDRFGLFVDGGLVGRNPSSVGGTWAWCLVKSGDIFDCGSGVILPQTYNLRAVTNNFSEMVAMLFGLEGLLRNSLNPRPPIVSDSAITLGRVSKGWSWTNIPTSIHQRYLDLLDREKTLPQWEFILVDGHPTKSELMSGVGRRGHPVSKWNVWCDEECQRLARLYLHPQRS